MNLLRIRIFGDPILREKAKPVRKIDKSISNLAKRMLETMRAEKGVGLAATQVGVLERICVCDPGENPMVLINPEIIEVSEEKEIVEEGCLSLPGVTVNIPRFKKIKVKALDLKGNVQIIEAEDILARIIQHEIDHLNGNLILDRASKEERRKALAELSKYFLVTQTDPTTFSSQ
jgi:peptide deformylase